LRGCHTTLRLAVVRSVGEDEGSKLQVAEITQAGVCGTKGAGDAEALLGGGPSHGDEALPDATRSKKACEVSHHRTTRRR
jgi:hypothetical protein